jgi:hypothetical protein
LSRLCVLLSSLALSRLAPYLILPRRLCSKRPCLTSPLYGDFSHVWYGGVQAIAQVAQIGETPIAEYYGQALTSIRVLTRVLPFLLEVYITEETR